MDFVCGTETYSKVVYSRDSGEISRLVHGESEGAQAQFRR